MVSNATFVTAGGELELWAVPGCSVMLRLLTKSTDPVELGEHEIEELISILLNLNKIATGDQ